jgi:hypothetical protein
MQFQDRLASHVASPKSDESSGKDRGYDSDKDLCFLYNHSHRDETSGGYVLTYLRSPCGELAVFSEVASWQYSRIGELAVFNIRGKRCTRLLPFEERNVRMGNARDRVNERNRAE